MTLDPAIADALRATTTATLTTVLLKKGIRRCWMRGPMPRFNAGERLVGPAFTLRFVPAREDLATPESWSSPRSTRAAIEDMPEGCIAVVGAMGVEDAGIFGDILVARMRKRGVTALVTDGVVRDGAGVEGAGCRSGARASRRRPPSRASPSWAGRSRSAAAGSRSSPTTSSWRTATARS
jgi:regulator of RNase E activity RraA